MALRKIEGRGELPNNPSAVMEMCVDNPRSGIVDLFSTHPSIDSRVDALVRMAAGHDPGPIHVADDEDYESEEQAEEQAAPPTETPEVQKPEQRSPFPTIPGMPDNIPLPIPGIGKPFLPSKPPLGERSEPRGGEARGVETRGPWGPRGEG
jgi:heat shock protein HtpX